MARNILLGFLLVGSSYTFGESNHYIQPSTPNQKSIQAFEQFWKHFDEYQEKRFIGERQKIRSQWETLKESYRQKVIQQNQSRLSAINTAIRKHQGFLGDHRNADNLPYVLLNLANLLYQKAHLTDQQDKKTNPVYREEALNHLSLFTKEFPDHPLIEKALYLKAVLYESVDRNESALKTWRQLARKARTPIYGIHGNLAIGDHYFGKEESDEALPYYEKAYRIAMTKPIDNKDNQLLRIEYRLLWAAYRSALLNKTIGFGLKILRPGRHAQDLDWKKRLYNDAKELIGDSLFENNDMVYTKATLERKEIRQHGPKIGLRIMFRYHKAGVYSDSAEIGEYLIEKFPVVKDSPEIISQTAHAYEKLGRDPQRIAALEKLALFLPTRSLWRQRHQMDHEATNYMEKQSFASNEIVANYYYENGMANANPANFAAAASYYRQLINFAPQSKKVDRWRLNTANGFYFSNRLAKADKSYSNLKDKYRVSTDILEVASFQLILTREKRWRNHFGDKSAAGKDPTKHPEVIQSLVSLENAVEDYANRFPSRERAVDGLLVAASANRDHSRWARAEQFWQRVMINKANPSQRSIAIRGLISVKIQNRKPGNVLNLTKRFLRLENWDSVGTSLGNELKGILSSAAKEKSANLYDQGNVAEAGKLLTQLTSEFKAIPNWDTLYRDGAFMLAIADQWDDALKAAQAYIDSGAKKKVADMTYLKARAYEYQLNFNMAAATYFELAQNFPKHPKSNVSLKRSETLSVNEENLIQAAAAAQLMAQRTRKRSEKLSSYRRAIRHLESVEEYQKAADVCQELAQSARTRVEKLYADLYLARNLFKAGQETRGLALYQTVATRSAKVKSKIDFDDFASISGEANFKLGFDDQERFKDYQIIERSGKLFNKIDHKSKIFATLVKRYEKAAATDHVTWSTRSRFSIGQSAENLSEEIHGLVNKSGDLSTRQQDSLNQMSERLKQVAKKYYSANILAYNKNPKKFKNNRWIKKSQVKLSGYSTLTMTPNSSAEVPFAMKKQIPSQWRGR